jgi:hypothetical protein
MKFEELNSKMFGTLSDDKIIPSESEFGIIKKIKQGKHLLLSASNSSSLDLILCWSTLSRAYQAFEGSPRVLWITNSDQRVHDIVKQLRNWSRRTEVAIEPANDKGKIIEQRNFIFEGADAVVGNPKRILEIYNQSGIHVNQLNLIIIDEVDSICKNPNLLQNVRRICESTEKCMKLVVRYGEHERIDAFMDEICFDYDELVYEQ